MVDVSMFNITTPAVDEDGDAVTYWPDNFPNDQYFSFAGNGDLLLWAPTKGATSNFSSKTRCEFREIVPIDPQNPQYVQKNWQVGEFADQFLRAALTLEQVNEVGRVFIAQIHGKDTLYPPFKLLFDNGAIKAKFRTTFDELYDESTTILTNVSLNSRFSYSIHVGDAGEVSVNVAQGTNTGSCLLEFDSSYQGKLLYFKAGLYNAETATTETLETEGSRATFHKLEIERIV